MVNLAFLFISLCFHPLLLFSLLSSDPTKQIENGPYKWEPNGVLWTTLPLSSIRFLLPLSVSLPKSRQALPSHGHFSAILCSLVSGIRFSTTPCCPRPHKSVFREFEWSQPKDHGDLKQKTKKHPESSTLVVGML